MNQSRIATFAACIAATATLLAPRPAAAHDDDRRPVAAFAVSLPPAPPPWVVAVLPPPAPGPWGGYSPYVYSRWLEANRSAYLARFGWNPWRVSRYEAWYRGQRAALAVRAAPPVRVAWDHDRGNGRGHGRRDR